MDFKFQTDYAKSNQSVCRGCQQKIVKNTLRLAIMLQSHSFDGKVPNWYHLICFFNEHMPRSTIEILHFDLLRWEDQKEIQAIIDKGEINYDEDFARKRISVEASRASLEKFSVSYSKTTQCSCEVCSEKIQKDEIQIVKKVTSKKLMRYHLQCFCEKRSDIGFFEAGTDLNGFKELNDNDQNIIKDKLINISETIVPKKKQRLSDEVIQIFSEEDELSKSDIDLLHEYRDQLKTQLTKAQIELLLKYNKQYVPKGLDNMLDLASDMMTFGALGKCPSCKRGQLTYTSLGYKCSGLRSEWSKCTDITKDPIRNPVRIPEELKILFTFLMVYEYIPREKKVEPISSHPPRKSLPLDYLNFAVLGFMPGKEWELRQKIESLGGRIVPHVKRSVLAVVTTREELQRHGSQIAEAKKCQVYVVSHDFITAIAHVTSQDVVLDIIKKFDMGHWGLELNCRIPPEFQKSPENLKKHIPKTEQEEEGIKKVTVKKGLAIEPNSGLENIAHVYQRDNNIYTAVLTRTDIGVNENKYYKLQLLEADEENKYWFYRSWGRTGTDYGSYTVDEMADLKTGIKEFERYFKKKTGNSWSSRRCMIKKPGLYCYVETDYRASKEEINLENHVADSQLHPAVAHLIAFIFNIHSMEKLMLEYSLDTQKMPLGKLSKSQIKLAYSVLSEATLLINHQSKPAIVECSNKFYSLMPHNSALSSPPLLDNMDIIKKKLEMLENLFEIETAYCMIHRNASTDAGNLLDAYYKELCTDIEILQNTADEYPFIEQYVMNTHADTHRSYNLKILEVFKINRHEEPERYKKYDTLHNRKLLWHGSRTTNFAGILSQGLRVAPPEAPATGAMFGKGVYFADMVSKSANYCCITPDSEREGLLLLCEVALGNVCEKYKAHNMTKLPPNVHSVKGVGKTSPDEDSEITLVDGVKVPLGKPVTHVDVKSDLLYNEYIVYDIAQVKIKYLLKVKFDFRSFH